MTDVSQANYGATSQTSDTTADKFKSQFAQFKGQATDKARNYAGQGVGKATDALDEAARFLEDTARQIEEKLGPQYGRYGFSAAESVSGFAEQLRGKEVDELVDDVRNVVRKSPAAAIGAAVGLGFILARLAKAGAGYENAGRTSALASTGTGMGTGGAMSTSGTAGMDSALVGTSSTGSTDLSTAASGTGGLGGTTNAAPGGSPITPTFPA